jgi:hypothetical protein
MDKKEEPVYGYCVLNSAEESVRYIHAVPTMGDKPQPALHARLPACSRQTFSGKNTLIDPLHLVKINSSSLKVQQYWFINAHHYAFLHLCALPF